MKLLETECSNCGAKLERIDRQTLKCSFCGATFLVVERETELANITNTPKNNKALVGIILSIFVFTIILPIIFFIFSASEQSGGEDSILNTDSIYSDNINDTFTTFCETIFNKNHDDITGDDFETVSYLSVKYSRDYTEVICIANDIENNFTYEGNPSYIVKYAYKFVNLETLICNSQISAEYIEGLNKLTHLTCSNNINDLPGIHSCPEKLLTLKGVYCEDTIENLTAFSSITTLELNMHDSTKDISALGDLTTLEALSLDSYHEYKQFGFLDKLYNLKELYIDCEGLHNIDFVKNMNQLESLNIEGSSITSLAPLKGNTNLKTLLINNCDKINDVEIVNTINGLETLSLSGESIYDKILWENLHTLKDLRIDSFLDSNFVENAYQLTSLEHLHLGWCGQDLTDLNKLTNLKSLTLEYINTNYYFLNGMTSLESIVIQNVLYNSYGAENIFQLPNIKNITLFDGTFYIDTDRISENSSIEKIDIKYCSLRNIDYNSLTETELSDIIEKCPSLKEFYLRGADITTIDFVTMLPNLEIIDITNNFVSDLTPLTNCKNLKYVKCGDNAYSSLPTFPEGIYVDQRGEENIRYK